MLQINPKEVSVAKLHAYLLNAVAPRPIAFASTIDGFGNPNLSPFSFFNAFGSNPATLIFAPNRRVRDNTNKHTFENIKEIPEVVINVVNYNMVHQTSLSSTEYPKGVNEFVKAGFTPIASEKIRPFRVKESPVQFECKVVNVIETGNEGGAGNLIVCEILLMHINENILDSDGKIDPNKIDLVARMGGDLYCRASGNAIFEVAKPLQKLGVGVDAIPEKIKLSNVLTGNNLGQLGNAEKIPTSVEIEIYEQELAIQDMLSRFVNDRETLEFHLHQHAKELLEQGKVEDAWKTLMISL